MTQKQVKFTQQIEINALPYQVIAPDITGVHTDSLGKSIAGSPCVRVSNTARIAEEILDFGQGRGHYVSLDWLSEGYGLSAYGNWCDYHR